MKYSLDSWKFVKSVRMVFTGSFDKDTKAYMKYCQRLKDAREEAKTGNAPIALWFFITKSIVFSYSGIHRLLFEKQIIKVRVEIWECIKGKLESWDFMLITGKLVGVW